MSLNLVSEAREDSYRYAGLEYFGSSQLTQDEVNKMLRLKRGAKAKSVELAVQKFEKKIDNLKLFANVQIVTSTNNRIFVVVDIIEPSHDEIVTRKLNNPRHVVTKSEKPNILLNQLKARLNQLNMTGRPWKQELKGGIKYFSDEPANQIVTQIRKYAPTMRTDWLNVVASDPNPDRRVEAIELLNWSESYPDTCYSLIGAIDDSNYLVRSEAVKFIYKRLDLLPDNFPYPDLMHAICRQVRRPSHEDRVKSLYMMYKVIRKRPKLTPMASNCAQKYVNTYCEHSKIPVLRSIAERLKTQFSHPVRTEPVKKTPHNSGF